MENILLKVILLNQSIYLIKKAGKKRGGQNVENTSLNQNVQLGNFGFPFSLEYQYIISFDSLPSLENWHDQTVTNSRLFHRNLKFFSKSNVNVNLTN